MFYPILLLALCGTLLSGCGSFLPDRKTLPGPTAIEVYQARREAPPALQPALSALPRAPINDPRPATLSQAPLPVWNDAQVVRVELDAYVNEKGEAFGPSVKYVVQQPGGWNVDALRNPHRAYVPSENLPPIPSRSGYSSNPLVAPGDGVRTLGDLRPTQPSMLQDLSRVRVTGFIERAQEPMARQLAQPGEVTLFDESLGWILVPSSALVPSNQIPSLAPVPAQQPLQMMSAPGYAPMPAYGNPVPAMPAQIPPSYGQPATLGR